MKRIFFSLGMIAFVASIVATSTGAFFSDTETSTNNIFTAGSIDLKIDHSLSTYNGNAVINDLVIVSDTQTTFTGDDGAGNAVALSFVHPAWTAVVPGATWIWATNPVSNPTITQTRTPSRARSIGAGPVVSASMKFAADNYYHVILNGNVVGDNQSLTADNFQQDHLTDVTAFIVQGLNTITFVGKNEHVDGSTPAENPAGIIFRLDVHGLRSLLTRSI
jgi:predicted ribosomally synthesized peptide with SipW-like signal peptide